MRWRLYWTYLFTILFGTSLFFNTHRYPDKPWAWRVGKTSIDVTLTSLLCWLFPPLLITFGVYWIYQHTKHENFWKMCIGTVTSALLAGLSTFFLEGLALFGVGSIDVLTGRWVRYYEQNRFDA